MSLLACLLAVAGFLFLLAAAAFFSGLETGFLSISPAKAGHLASEGDRRAAEVVEYLKRPERYIGATLVGVNLAHISISVLTAWFMGSLLESRLADLVTALVLTPVILLAGEVLPKSLFRQHAHGLTIRLVTAFRVAERILSPLTGLVLGISHALMRDTSEENLRGIRAGRDEIQALIREGERRGVVEDDEADLIESVFEISETLVKEVMVPRINIVGFPLDAPFDIVMETARRESYSRYPVWKETPDEPVGVIHYVSLLDADPKGFSLADSLIDPHFIPETMRVDDALAEMRKKGVRLAIVVDEYGGTAGIVTIEDLLEEIVGEIEDEIDRTVVDIVPDALNEWRVGGFTDLDELAEKIGFEYSGEDGKVESETIGGLVTELIGRIPRAGEKVRVGEFEFEILEADARRVSLLRIRRFHER